MEGGPLVRGRAAGISRSQRQGMGRPRRAPQSPWVVDPSTRASSTTISSFMIATSLFSSGPQLSQYRPSLCPTRPGGRSLLMRGCSSTCRNSRLRRRRLRGRRMSFSIMRDALRLIERDRMGLPPGGRRVMRTWQNSLITTCQSQISNRRSTSSRMRPPPPVSPLRELRSCPTSSGTQGRTSTLMVVTVVF